MGFISLSNVFFGYDTDSNLLDGVSIVFNNTDKIAIVGDNGSGKTTLLRLLNGDITPDSGHVVRNADVYMVNQFNSIDKKAVANVKVICWRGRLIAMRKFCCWMNRQTIWTQMPRRIFLML